MTEILNSSVLLICDNDDDRSILRAQLDLMGLWGRIVEAEMLADAQCMTMNQQPSLCIWRIPDNQDNYQVFFKSKSQLGQQHIVLGQEQDATLFFDDHFLSLPHKFQDLQAKVRETILPHQVYDALSNGKELQPGEQEHIYRDLFDRGGDANLLLDYETHIIIDANQRALDMYGVTREEIIGMNMLELVADTEHPNMWRDTQILKNSNREHIFVDRLDRKEDGTPMHVTVSGALFEFGGRLVFQDIVRDETERRLAKEQEMKLRIEQERVKTLRRFINDATHDLMTPLSIIKTSLYIAEKSPDEIKRKEKLGLIGIQVERLQQMVEDMMMVAKLDTTTPEQLARVHVNLNDLIQMQVNNYQPISQQYRHALTTSLPSCNPSLPLHLEYIQLAFAKLLDNAIQYTEEGGNIHISVDISDEVVLISITDNGVGIPKDHQRYIFDRFYRVEEHRPMNSGSGLGLTIAKSIVELHYGQIEVTSKAGVGSTFKIYLPKRRPLGNVN